jgi:hypothetical protein
MVPCEQHLHGKPIARGNSPDQDFVRCRLHHVLTVGSWISRAEMNFGSTIRDGLCGTATPGTAPPALRPAEAAH